MKSPENKDNFVVNPEALAGFINPTVAMVHNLQKQAEEFQLGVNSIISDNEHNHNGSGKPDFNANLPKVGVSQGVHHSIVCCRKGSRA